MDKPLCSSAQFLFRCVTFSSRLVRSQHCAFLVVCVMNADTLKRHKGKTSVFRALPVSSAGLGYRSRADVFHRFHTRRSNLRMRSLLQRLRNLRHSSVRMCKKELEKKNLITGTIAFFERMRECVSRALALKRTQACGFNSLDCQMTPAPHAGTHKYAHNMCGSPPGSPDPERWKIPSVPHRSHNLS